MDDERETTDGADAADRFAELRERVSREAMSEGTLDSVALGVSARDASLSEAEYLDLSG